MAVARSDPKAPKDTTRLPGFVGDEGTISCHRSRSCEDDFGVVGKGIGALSSQSQLYSFRAWHMRQTSIRCDRFTRQVREQPCKASPRRLMGCLCAQRKWSIPRLYPAASIPAQKSAKHQRAELHRRRLSSEGHRCSRAIQ